MNHGAAIKPILKHQLIAVAILAISAVVCLASHTSVWAARSAQPNILWIVLDAVRPDHLGCYGYDRPTSPNVDEVAAAGVLFETAIAQAPWTRASFASFLTSRYPFQTGVTDWNTMLPDTCITLQQVLRDNGYHTVCVLDLPGMAENWQILKGFEDKAIIKHSEGMAKRTTDKACALLSKSDGPFFALVHYYHAHAPYMPSEEFRALFRRDRVHKSTGVYEQDLYDACIREVDAEVGRLLGALAERGLEDNTIVIVTADHGEAFGEHGRSGHGWSLHEEEIRVPLVLRYPACCPGGQRISAQVRLLDLAPTLLDIAGIRVPDRCEGLNVLRPAMTGSKSPLNVAATSRDFFPTHVAYSSTSMRAEIPPTKSVRTARWKVMVEPLTGLTSAFDLKADPEETTNIWPSDAAPLDSLFRMLRMVPGFSERGWRLAFTDEGRKVTYEARVSIPGDARIVNVRKKSNTGFFEIEISEDAKSMRVTAETQDLNSVLFNTEPRGAEIEVTVSAVGGSAPVVCAGRQGTYKMGEVFRATNDSGQGLPQAFEQSRNARTPGAFIWWMPGDEMPAPKPTATLSPEEQKRLKSLGYIN